MGNEIRSLTRFVSMSTVSATFHSFGVRFRVASLASVLVVMTVVVLSGGDPKPPSPADGLGELSGSLPQGDAPGNAASNSDGAPAQLPNGPGIRTSLVN